MSQIQAGRCRGDQGQIAGQLSYAVDSYTHRVQPATILYFLLFTFYLSIIAIQFDPQKIKLRMTLFSGFNFTSIHKYLYRH